MLVIPVCLSENWPRLSQVGYDGRDVADLVATSLGVELGQRVLFSDLAVTLEPSDRVALVGPNGAGKTTLLRVLAGALTPSTGDVHVPAHLHIELHDQRPPRTSEKLVDYVAPRRMVALEQELRELEHRMGAGDDGALKTYGEVRDRYDALGGEAWHHRVIEVLRGLGFTDEQHDQSLDTLSGGELTRASLTRVLAADADILLLDEPTNHLDIASIAWLEEYLGARNGSLVVVSHDRWFIESLCTSVIEVSDGRARCFPGSFVEYRAQQALEAATHGRQLERWQSEVVRLERFVTRFRAGTRSKQAQSRAKTLEKLRSDVPAYADLRSRRGVSFRLPTPPRSGRLPLDVRGLDLGFPSRTLITPTDLAVERGEKIALLGKNGSGKSTVLQALAAACLPLVPAPDAQRGGEIRVGYGTVARLVSQHDSELRDDLSLLGNMRLAEPSIGTREAMSLLGLFGFSGPESERLVQELSGGERRRVLMAAALTGACNLLLLDEPTNHLDLEGREALEAALAEYDGTVLLISHDRALIEGVATRVLLLDEQQITTCTGGYDQAEQILVGRPPTTGPSGALPSDAQRSEESKRPSTTVEATSGSSSATSSGQRRRRKGAGRRSGSAVRVRRPATIEREIESAEAALAGIAEQMLDPDVYTSPEKSAAALEQHGQLEHSLSSLYEELEASLAHFGE